MVMVIQEVDLVPTLALLLGVPIPKNSVGVLLPQLFDTLPAVQRLRALEVNSWQIMKLLKVRYPTASCMASICSGKLKHENDKDMKITELCRMFSTATSLHEIWRNLECNSQHCVSGDWEVVSEAYLLFLRTSSDWLARGTTEKNIFLVFVGGFIICCSTVLLLGITSSVNLRMHSTSKYGAFQSFKLEKWIAIVGVCGHAMSFYSSSFVEEEQFTLHFLVVTLWCSIFRGVFQKWDVNAVSCRRFKLSWDLSPSSSRFFNEGHINVHSSSASSAQVKPLVEAFAVILLLVCGTALRGWHRGGVNWVHLPDFAKRLEQSGPLALLACQSVTLALVVVICCRLVLEQSLYTFVKQAVVGVFLLIAFLVEWYNLRTCGSTAGHSDQWSIIIARLVYTLLGGTIFAVVILAPHLSTTQTKHTNLECRGKNVFEDWQACGNFIGKVSVSCWCLLQLLLQQPVNSIPVLLLLLQLICCLVFFKLSGSSLDLWLKILILYLMGGSGHFGMGNTNTLATVDVAGAYIGLSQHSIFLSGLLAFFITYAAPLMYMLGMLLMISINEVDASVDNIYQSRGHWLLETIVLTCSVPLLLSSLVLVSFTFVLLLMQGHLFIWSVFSPKYIYVCFTVFSTYWGVIFNALALLYTYLVVRR